MDKPSAGVQGMIVRCNFVFQLELVFANPADNFKLGTVTPN